jgi:arsenate reductase-like glutaredoxin family protein
MGVVVYRAKQITRAELEAWLAEQDDEQEIRVIFNKLRG